jgi:hypothetical protein
MRLQRIPRGQRRLNFKHRDAMQTRKYSLQARQAEMNRHFDYTTTLFYKQLAKRFPLTERFFNSNHHLLTDKKVKNYGVHLITPHTKNCMADYNRRLPKQKELAIKKAFDEFKDDMDEAASRVRIIEERHLGPRVIRKLLFAITKDFYSNH